MFGQLLQSISLQIDIVIVVEVIDANDRLTVRQQSPGGMKTDEPGSPGDKNPIHCFSLLAYNESRFR
jgi:hypothetical protein